jgi:shikimate kinase
MNIILIGFKSSGKSTVGDLLARLSGKSFIDTDYLVESLFDERASIYLSCRGIYQKFGAAYMRELETDALKALSELDNCVVATGGGIVLQAENVPLLQKAGLTVFLDVPLEVLEKRLAGSASPLFREKSVAGVYAERYPLYAAAAAMHYRAGGDADPQEIALSLHNELADYCSKLPGCSFDLKIE